MSILGLGKKGKEFNILRKASVELQSRGKWFWSRADQEVDARRS